MATAMLRSSFSENPLLRVSRPVSACSRCRAAKVKCDGKLPACTACEKAGREGECSSANDQFARGKERSYVAALELRIEKLEKRLAYARSRKASVALHDPDQQPAEVDRKDSLATIRAAIHRKAARKRENSDVNTLVSDFGFLSINATTRDFEPSISNMTFARLVLAAATYEQLPPPQNDGMPTRLDAQALVQYYMDNVYVLFPSFADGAVFAILNDVYQEDDRAIKDSDYWTLYMVMAVAAAAQSRSCRDEWYETGVEYAGRAMRYADKALMPGYVNQILSLTLFTQYAMLDPAHFDSWHLIGFTCRAVIDLGFHQDPPTSQVSDKASLDVRRKVFYTVYALDRAISMVHARAFSFTDASINVAFPNPRPTLSAMPSPTGLAIPGPQSSDPSLLLFQLRRAQSHWYQALFQSDPTPLPDATAYIWQMCLDMREWGESLPDSLAPGVRELFDLELRYSYVYCLAPSARAPHMTDYGRALIFEHAVAYLETIHAVAHGAGAGGPDAAAAAFYTYHDALKVYFMANQFVAVLRDSADMLLAGAAAASPPLTRRGAAPPPPIPARAARGPAGDDEDNLDRSLRCLGLVRATLLRYGERWEDSLSLMTHFERISAELHDALRARRAARDAARAQMAQMAPAPGALAGGGGGGGGGLQQPRANVSRNPSPVRPQPQMVPQPQQMADVQWADMDVAQLLRGEPGA